MFLNFLFFIYIKDNKTTQNKFQKPFYESFLKRGVRGGTFFQKSPSPIIITIYKLT